MSKDKEFIIIKDGFVSSIVTDFITYGTIIPIAYINHRYIGDSLLVSIFVIMGLIGFGARLLSKKKRIFTNKEDAIKHIESFYDKD